MLGIPFIRMGYSAYDPSSEEPSICGQAPVYCDRFRFLRDKALCGIVCFFSRNPGDSIQCIRTARILYGCILIKTQPKSPRQRHQRYLNI